MGNKTIPLAIRVGTLDSSRNLLVDRSYKSRWSARQRNQRGDLTTRDQLLRSRRKDWLVQSGYLCNTIHVYRSALSVDIVAQIYRVVELNLITDSYGDELTLTEEISEDSIPSVNTDTTSTSNTSSVTAESKNSTSGVVGDAEAVKTLDKPTDTTTDTPFDSLWASASDNSLELEDLHEFLRDRVSRFVEHGKCVHLSLDLLNNYIDESKASTGEEVAYDGSSVAGLEGPFEQDFKNIVNLRFVGRLPVAPLRAQRLGYAISSASRRESDIYRRVQRWRLKEFERPYRTAEDVKDLIKEHLGLNKDKGRKLSTNYAARRKRWKISKLLTNRKHQLPGVKLLGLSDRVSDLDIETSSALSRGESLGGDSHKTRGGANSNAGGVDELDPDALRGTVDLVSSISSKVYVGGFLVEFKGRLNGSERKRVTQLRAGSLPRHRITAAIDWGRAESYTSTGALSIKIQVYYTTKRPRIMGRTDVREME